MADHDAIRFLQDAARPVTAGAVPGTTAGRVAIQDAFGRELFAVVVPAGPSEARIINDEPPAVSPGWNVSERKATFDGRVVHVAPSRLKLLQALVEATGKISAKDLIEQAFDAQTSETNARYHVAELRKELAAAFPGFEGELVTADGGYQLAIR